LAGASDDWTAVAEALQRLGPSAVVITLGERGAIGLFGEQVVVAEAPKVAAVDSTGAGDAFCGAFAALLAEGAEPQAALQAAVVAGSLSVTVEGAQRSMPTREQIDALLASTR
jgi:ribokinase